MIFKSFLLVRKELFTSLIQQLEIVETKFPVRVLRSKNNTISVAIILEAEADQERGEGEERSRGAGAGQLTNIGSMLFTRGVSGTRVVTGQTCLHCVIMCNSDDILSVVSGTDNKCIEGVTFAGWGSHTDHTAAAYLTAAAAIGMTKLDLDRPAAPQDPGQGQSSELHHLCPGLYTEPVHAGEAHLSVPVH